MYSSRFDTLAGHFTTSRASGRPGVVMIPVNITWADSASSLGPAVAAAVWVCAICWLPGKVRIAALWCRKIMVMATVRKIAPTNSAFLFIYELKTEPQEKFLFPDSLVSNF
jgi:hypothetical protein